MALPVLMMKLSDKSFTLVEVLVVIAILVFCLCGLLVTYINMFFLTDLSRDFTLATHAIQKNLEEIKNTGFDCLSTSACPTCDCPTSTSCPTGCASCFRDKCTFDLSGFSSSDAKGFIEIKNMAYPDLKEVRIVACFKSRGRLIGEDKNLNGNLDTGEDANGNGRLDSPVELVTLIAK